MTPWHAPEMTLTNCPDLVKPSVDVIVTIHDWSPEDVKNIDVTTRQHVEISLYYCGAS